MGGPGFLQWIGGCERFQGDSPSLGHIWPLLMTILSPKKPVVWSWSPQELQPCLIPSEGPCRTKCQGQSAPLQRRRSSDHTVVNWPMIKTYFKKTSWLPPLDGRNHPQMIVLICVLWCLILGSVTGTHGDHDDLVLSSLARSLSWKCSVSAATGDGESHYGPLQRTDVVTSDIHMMGNGTVSVQYIVFSLKPVCFLK